MQVRVGIATHTSLTFTHYTASRNHPHQMSITEQQTSTLAPVTSGLALPLKPGRAARKRMVSGSWLLLGIVATALWAVAGGTSPRAFGFGVAFAALTLSINAALMRDRGDYHAALSVRMVRHAQSTAFATMVVLAASAVLDLGMSPARVAVAGLALWLFSVAVDFHWHRLRSTSRPLRVLGLGSGEAALRLKTVAAVDKPKGMELIGFVDDGAGVVSTVGGLADLDVIVAEHEVDAVVLTSQDRRLELLEHVLALPGRTPSVLELSDFYERAYGRVPIADINAAWFLEALALQRRSVASIPRRAVELMVTLVLAVVALPVMALVAIAIKLDSPGTVFYRQRRVGEGGRTFTIVKFRSMRSDAESNGVQWASERDPRVTRVGSVLRRCRLDELPQVWNVLKGEMALVGPRPERPELVAELVRHVPFYEPRHLVRPGVTGWAQVYAPYASSVQESVDKLSYDLYYVKHQSFATDVGIMLSTLGVMAGGKGAR